MPELQRDRAGACVGGAGSSGSGGRLPGLPGVVEVRASGSIRAGTAGVRAGEAQGGLTPHQLYMRALDEALLADTRGERIREAFARGFMACLETVYPQTCGRHRVQE